MWTNTSKCSTQQPVHTVLCLQQTVIYQNVGSVHMPGAHNMALQATAAGTLLTDDSEGKTLAAGEYMLSTTRQQSAQIE